MRLIILLVAMLLSGCVVQSQEDDIIYAQEDGGLNFIPGGKSGGGSGCKPAIYLEIDGAVFYEPMMCPIPTLKPEPDPAIEIESISCEQKIISPAQKN